MANYKSDSEAKQTQLLKSLSETHWVFIGLPHLLQNRAARMIIVPQLGQIEVVASGCLGCSNNGGGGGAKLGGA